MREVVVPFLSHQPEVLELHRFWKAFASRDAQLRASSVHAQGELSLVSKSVAIHWIAQEDLALSLSLWDDQSWVTPASTLAGLSFRAVNEAFSYSELRIQGGKPIGRWSALEVEVGKLVANASVIQELLGRAVELAEDHRGALISSALCMHLAEVSVDVVSRSLQIFGGAGYMKDYPMERLFRVAHQVMSRMGPQAERNRAIAEGLRKKEAST